MGSFDAGKLAGMTTLDAHSLRARISTVRCDSCMEEVTPDFDAHNLGHSCPGEGDLLSQVEYEVEMNTVLCDKCAESYLPTLGEIHSC